MHIAAIALSGRALSWVFWHLTYLLRGQARRALEFRDRLRRCTGR